MKPQNDEMTDYELLVFIRDFSKELIVMAGERGMYSLLPAFKSAEMASRNILAKKHKRRRQ